MVWPTLGSRTAKEQEQLLNLLRQLGEFIASNVQYIANSNSGSHWVRIKEGSHGAELN